MLGNGGFWESCWKVIIFVIDFEKWIGIKLILLYSIILLSRNYLVFFIIGRGDDLYGND